MPFDHCLLDRSRPSSRLFIALQPISLQVSLHVALQRQCVHKAAHRPIRLKAPKEAGSKGTEQRQAAEAEELAASTTKSTGWTGCQQCPSLLAVGGLAAAVPARRHWYLSAAAQQDQQDMPHSVSALQHTAINTLQSRQAMAH